MIKKVILLFILLLLLIVYCVYSNLPKFAEDSSITLNSDTNTKINIIKEEEKLVSKPLEQFIEKPKEEISKNKIIEQEPIKKPLEEKELTQKPVKKEEVVLVEQKKSFTRIDEQYRRNNGELTYDKLSSKAKELQKTFYELMENEPIEYKKMSSYIYSKNKDKIKKLFTILRNNRNIKVEIAGHYKNSLKDESFNQELSVLRASKLKKELNNLGIKSFRMKARGYGSKIPLENENGILENRVELNIIGE